jgi:hypothetical protein
MVLSFIVMHPCISENEMHRWFDWSELTISPVSFGLNVLFHEKLVYFALFVSVLLVVSVDDYSMAVC